MDAFKPSLPKKREQKLASSSRLDSPEPKRPSSAAMLLIQNDDDKGLILPRADLSIAGSSTTVRPGSGIRRPSGMRPPSASSLHQSQRLSQDLHDSQTKLDSTTRRLSRPKSGKLKSTNDLSKSITNTSRIKSTNDLGSSKQLDDSSKLHRVASKPTVDLQHAHSTKSISKSKSPTKSSPTKAHSKSDLSKGHEPTSTTTESPLKDTPMTPDPPKPLKTQYKPSPFQLKLCELFMPDEESNTIPKNHSDYTITHCYSLLQTLNINILQVCVNKLVQEYPVLSTTIYRNEKILDADIQFFLDNSLEEEIPLSKYVKSYRFEFSKQKPPIIQIWSEKEKFLPEINLNSPFKVCLIDAPTRDTKQFLFLGCSLTILDNFSLLWLTKRIFDLYVRVESNYSEKSPLDAYSCEEIESFEDYASYSTHSAKDYQFWKDQIVEVEQNQLAPMERKTLESQLNKLESEKASLKTSLVSASKKRQEFDEQLAKLRHQRMEIEKSISGDGPLAHFTDSVTGEITVVSQATKDALLKAVLGEEAVGDNILPLLKKHEVSNEVLRKLNASQMTLEQFSGLTEGVVTALNLNGHDKRQILALAEYVNNRIKECIQEQGKVKFTLEREIAKISRGLEASTNDLSQMRTEFDSKEDLSYRLQTILHPPYEEIKVKSLSAQNLFDSLQEDNVFQDVNKWGFIPFKVEESILDNLRKFRIDWTLNITNKRKQARAKAKRGDESSDNESLLESDDEDDGKKRLEKRMKHKSVNSVCLAAFGVLMKHVTGNEKFLVGVIGSFRNLGLIVGPLTEVYPVKIDLSKKDMSFSSLFTSLFRIFKQIRRHGYSCPMTTLSEKLGIPMEFPVQFQFITWADYTEWTRLGLTLKDILNPHEMTEEQFGSLKTERLWCDQKNDDCDIKFIMVEQEDCIECGVRFKNNKFEPEKIAKWIQKFKNTLEGIDCNRRKLSVSAMISRFYHPLWQADDVDVSESMSNLTSSASAMNLFSSPNLVFE